MRAHLLVAAVDCFLLAILVVFSAAAQAQPLDPHKEIRYCHVDPVRDAAGKIKRSSAVIRAFRATHPCPATGSTAGPCAGWAMDHIVPLAVGGCDTVWNMQWLPNGIKSAAGELAKDRWERKVYQRP